MSKGELNVVFTKKLTEIEYGLFNLLLTNGVSTNQILISPDAVLSLLTYSLPSP